MEFRSLLMHHHNGRSYSSPFCHLFQHIFVFLLPFSTAGIDFISRTQYLMDGQTLVSPGERFELGFFSPGSTKNRYVGVWYKNISGLTVVWVANRESPLSDSSGMLSVDNHGNLVVLDGNRTVLWSCNASAVLKNSTAVLNDSGNLIVREEASPTKILWQSFENPSDTFLPKMEFGIDIDPNVGRRQHLTSWKSESDPSPGDFSLGMELLAVRLPQIFLYNGSNRIWRSGYWNGQIFVGVSTMNSYTTEIKLSVDYQERRMYLTFDESSYITRFVVDWRGSFKQPTWHEDSKEWLIDWVASEKQCDVFGTCGAFGSCDSSKAPHICSCLDGFEPKRLEEWETGNWSSGCVRRTQLQCSQEANNATSSGSRYADDGFLKIGGVKPPDSADWRSDETASDCERTCLSNCSCVAFAHVNGIGCMLWAEELIDIQQFPSGGVDLFIRLDRSEIGKNQSTGRWIIIIATVLGAIMSGIVASLLWRWTTKHRGKNNVGIEKHTKVSPGAAVDTVEELRGLELPLFDFDAIKTATDGLSDANKLGEGGFGSVFKGTLKDGQEIAVKRLSRSSGQGLVEFTNEVILISKLQHRNLVRLLGCCIEGDEKMLVYEYMPNKSLDTFLFDPHKRGLLHWDRRFLIIEGIARGLLYLHRDSRLRVIHRDLKASNILLDNEMNPKISDFGLARIFAGNHASSKTTRVAGTYGYLAPEYAMRGQFSEKSDVFSFGVVMLEIVSGRRNTGYYNDNHLNLIGYAWSLWNEDKALQLVDQSLGNSFPTLQALRCIQVGLLCLEESAAERPALSSVILMLGEAACLPEPRQPAFSFATCRNSAPPNGQIQSPNDVTFTSLEGR